MKRMLLLICINLAIVLPTTFKMPIHRAQEARVAESAREILENKKWLFPTLNGKPRLEKPPLMTWLVATSFALTGKTNEPTARLPSICFSLLSAIAIFLFARYLFNSEYIAFWSALIQMTAFEFIRQSSVAEIDIAFQCAIACAIYCFYLYLIARTEQHKWLLSFSGYILAGLAVNFKGPAAIPLVLLPFIVFFLIKKQLPVLKPLWGNLIGTSLFFIIAFGWFALSMAEKDIATDVFSKELKVTFVAGADHHNPFYYYFYSLFRNFAPWTIFLYFAIYWLLVKKNKNNGEIFLLSWFLSAFFLLSITPNKQAHYSLLLFAPASIITARVFFAENFSLKINKFVSIVGGLTAAGACCVPLFLPVSLLEPDAALPKKVAKEIQVKEKESGTKLPIYTLEYLDIPLVFYYGKPIDKITVDNFIAYDEQGSNMFVVVMEKKKKTDSSVREKFKNQVISELAAGDRRYTLLKIP
jgi:4-amino-4-deoxy-L-arabinose transferase-like glycosyltransferase